MMKVVIAACSPHTGLEMKGSDSNAAQGRERVGVLGGSFDPVHLGHLVIAQDAAEALALDRVVFMPACRAPLKERPHRVSEWARYELVRLAIEGNPRFEVSDLELRRGGESYTIDTARELRRLSPRADLFWIVGADQAARLAEWRAIEALAELVQFAVVTRPGFPAVEVKTVPGLRLHPVRGHMMEISSSEIRERIRTGCPIRYFLPEKVYARIEADSLYR